MAKQLHQARAVVRAAGHWLRHDLPEIVFPGSMRNPPGYQPPPARTRGDIGTAFVRACRRYADTWSPGKMREERRARAAQQGATQEQQRQEGPTLSEEFAAAAKGGAQALQPFLANLYQSRARAYRDAVQQFVQGYKQGFEQAMQPEVPPEVASEMQAQAAATAAEPAATAEPGAAAPAAVGGQYAPVPP